MPFSFATSKVFEPGQAEGLLVRAEATRGRRRAERSEAILPGAPNDKGPLQGPSFITTWVYHNVVASVQSSSSKSGSDVRNGSTSTVALPSSVTVVGPLAVPHQLLAASTENAGVAGNPQQSNVST